jgi:hypothetical protein
MNPSAAHRSRHSHSSRGRSPEHIPLPAILNAVANHLPRNRPARIALAVGVFVIAAALLVGLLFRGSFPAGMAGPWISRALEERLGPGHRVEIGDTWFETDSSGAWLLRVQDLVVRGPDNEVVATAPSAEVQLEGGLFSGNYRARRIDLVNAEMTVQIAADGRVAVFAGRETQPTTPGARAALARPSPAAPPTPVDPSDPFRFAELVSWLDGLERSGLDGVALTQIGLKRGTLIVDSARSGRRWTFRNIDSRLERQAGGLSFALSSGDPVGRWSVNATVGTAADGGRAIDVLVDRVAPRDLLLAAGLDGLDFHADTPLSGLMRAQIAADGRLVSALARVTAAPGEMGRSTELESRFRLEDLQLQIQFDPDRRALVIDPIAVAAGSNRILLQAVIEAPRGAAPSWPIAITQGRVVLGGGSLIEPPLVIERVTARGAYDPRVHKVIIHQGDLSGPPAALAFSGAIGLGGDAPVLSLGIAGTRMSATAFKRLWPTLVAPYTRKWVMERVEGGAVERLLIALGVPLDSIGRTGGELPDSAARLEITASSVQYRPIAGLPSVRDASLAVTVTGRTARVRMESGRMDTPSGKRVAVRDGVLEVPDRVQPVPKGTVRFKLDGPADAVAEIVAMEPLRDVVGFTFDPATTRGHVSGLVQLELPFKANLQKEEVGYLVDADLKNFAAERVVRDQSVEAVNAKLSLTPTTAAVKGEGQIAGAPATFEYKRSKLTPDAEYRLSATFNDAVRARVGLDFSPWLSGPVAVRAQGRIMDRESRSEVEADLTAARISDLVPGWQKEPGRPSRATYRVVHRDAGGVKIENLSVIGSGTTLRGSIEFDGDGSLVAANLPVFHLGDGDKATLRTERSTDGVLKVFVRGERLDARGMMRSLTGGAPAPKSAREAQPRDLDIDLRLAAAVGNNGEVARQLELRISRRNGEVKGFALLGRIGANAGVVGELRSRDDGRPVLYVRADDAGAFFRFADIYSRIQRGEVWIVIEPPKATGGEQEGIIAVRDFVIRGESELARLQSAAPADREIGPQRRPAPQPGGSIAFSRLRLHFTRTPGRFVIREGIIFGPELGATVDGTLDYAGDHVQVRGTYIPAFGLNNLFGRIPVLGYILGGGPNEGLLAVTFEIVGPASRPTLRINPMSAVAPGFLRKIFEYRASPDIPVPQPLPR